jgi:hypothetical protein
MEEATRARPTAGTAEEAAACEEGVAEGRWPALAGDRAGVGRRKETLHS